MDKLQPVLLVLVGFGLLAASLSGCREDEHQKGSRFEQAEAHYRRGEYGAALDDYQAFLKRHRQSPLAETVRLRIRSINREVESVMSRQDMPRPDFVGKAGENIRADRSLPPVPSPEDRGDAGSDAAAPDAGSEGHP